MQLKTEEYKNFISESECSQLVVVNVKDLS